MKRRIVSICLALVFVLLPLLSCGKGDPPEKTEPNPYAASRALLTLLRSADSFSLDGEYFVSLGSDNAIGADRGQVVGLGSVTGGALSLTLTFSGTHTEDGAEREYGAEYALSGDTLSFTSDGSFGEVPLASLFPLAESAERIEALLTLLPFFFDDVSSVLKELGVGYSADDLYALFGELASLYRLLLLRVGQGQLLTVPTLPGDAARVLAACARVEEDEKGDKVYVFLFPTDALSAIFDRAAELSEMPLSDLADRLSGVGSAERLLGAIGTVAEGETLSSLLTRAAEAMLGGTVEATEVLSFLRALSTLTDTEELPSAIAELLDVDATEALRRLTGDPSLSRSDIPSLLSGLLSLSLDGFLSSIGRQEPLSHRLSEMSQTLSEIRLSLSFPCTESGHTSPVLSLSKAGEPGGASTAVSLLLSLVLD